MDEKGELFNLIILLE